MRQSAASELRARGVLGQREIAYLLGYTEHSSFSRAARRWRSRSE